MDGKEKWYKGQVLGLVPATSDWYNVQYDGENEILSLNLLVDVGKGDLDILLFFRYVHLFVIILVKIVC